MYSIGKINQKIYKCITEDIITEEVIITDNQIQHIKDRHPEAYNKVLKNIQEAISTPDYIIRDKHAYTGLIIKRIQTEEGFLQIVLRLCTSGDEHGYKNSVISCWKLVREDCRITCEIKKFFTVGNKQGIIYIQ